MELQKDWFQHTTCFLQWKDLNQLRLCCKEFCELVNTSLVWKIMLKKDFGLTESIDCKQKYMYWYKMFKGFYHAFGFVTPLLHKFLGLEEKVEMLIPNPTFDPDVEDGQMEEIEILAPNIGDMFASHLYQAETNGPQILEKNYFNTKQLEAIEQSTGQAKIRESEYRRWKNQARIAIELFFESDTEIFSLMIGVIVPPENLKLENHAITDEYLDIFTVLWGGNRKDSRKDKLTYIISQQTKVLKELKSVCNHVDYGEYVMDDYIIDL
jgi:hypothetical protein